MLRSLKDIERYTVTATDGDVGTVTNFLLDDKDWTVRYLVVKTDGFFSGRHVLISPISFRRADWVTKCFHVDLTRDKVKGSPSIDAHAPVSRQHERIYNQYYAYPYYWGYSGAWGMGTNPWAMFGNGWDGSYPDSSDATWRENHLRSMEELRGYHIQGTDDDIGHVKDFIVDDETWEVRYLVVDTSNWWFGRDVLVAPRWASRVSWTERLVYVDMTREKIKGSPEWDPSAPVNRQYETRLYDYYGRPLYSVGADNQDSPQPVRTSWTHAG